MVINLLIMCALFRTFLLILKKKRKKRVAENNQMLENLRINKLKAELEAKKEKKKKILDGNVSDLEFDRDYVSGHDSLPSSEDEQPAKVRIIYLKIN